jgi:hypothetical protein
VEALGMTLSDVLRRQMRRWREGEKIEWSVKDEDEDEDVDVED